MTIDVKACVFDAFGTLFNLSTPVEEIREIAGNQTDQLMTIWRRKQLEYTWLRASMNKYVPFNVVTHQALQLAMRETGLANQKLFDLLMPIYLNPSCFEDVPKLLSQLKKRDIKTAILSNGTPEMLQSGVDKTNLNNLLDEIISVDSLKTFKPNPLVYQLACDRFALDKSEILFLSSNRWDVAGAGAFGLRAVWVNQYNQEPEVLGPPPFKTIQKLSELAQLVSNLNQ